MKKILSVITMALFFVISAYALTPKNSTEAALINIKKPDVEMTKVNKDSTEIKMELINTSMQPVELVAATSNAAQKVQLHHFVTVNGRRIMRQIKQITIKPQSERDLSFHGIHIMLINLKQPIQVGETIPLRLIFSDGSYQQIDAKVVARKKTS